MLLQKVSVPSFLLLHSIPLYRCTTAFLSTDLLTDTWRAKLLYVKTEKLVALHLFFIHQQGG